MAKWTKTAGLLFLAAASVYSSQVIVAAAGRGAIPTAAPQDGVAATRTPIAAAPAPAVKVATRPQHKSTQEQPMLGAPEGGTDVKLVDDSANDPFATGPTTTPSTTGAATGGTAAAPTSQPSAGEGRSVSSSEVAVSDAGTVEI